MKLYLALALVVLMALSGTTLAKNDSDPLGNIWKEMKAIKEEIAQKESSPQVIDSAGTNLGEFIYLGGSPGTGIEYLVYNDSIKAYISYNTDPQIIGTQTNGVRFENSDCTGLAHIGIKEGAPGLVYQTSNGHYKYTKEKVLNKTMSESYGTGPCNVVTNENEPGWLTLEKITIIQPVFPLFIKQ